MKSESSLRAVVMTSLASGMVLGVFGCSDNPTPERLSQNILTGVVAAYSFDQGSGTTVPDASGNGHTGTLVGGVSWTRSGKFGGALRFDGTNDRVIVADANDLDLNAAWTLLAWVRPTNLSGWRNVLLKENGPNAMAYGLYANNHGTTPPGAWLNVGGNDAGAIGSSVIPLNTWTHLAARRNNDVLAIFRNGVQVGSITQPGNVLATTGVFTIGGNAAWGEWFAGKIDEVRVYGRALSDAEISSEMNSPTASGGSGGSGGAGGSGSSAGSGSSGGSGSSAGSGSSGGSGSSAGSGSSSGSSGSSGSGSSGGIGGGAGQGMAGSSAGAGGSAGQGTAGSAPLGLGGNWQLIFEDEFLGGAPSESSYNFYPVWGDNNNPAEDVAFRQGDTGPTTGLGGINKAAVSVSNGNAFLTSSKTATRYAGYDWPYRSAWLRTKTEYQYGYFEVRARVAAGQGLWTTFWMMPDPYDGNQAWEIDIAEFPGTGSSLVYQNVHWGVYEQGLQDLSSVGGAYSSAYHVYGVHWEPTRVRWFIDGVLKKTHTAHVPNVPMQLITFLETGGPSGWVGPFDGTTPLPRSTAVDYVRIYSEAR